MKVGVIGIGCIGSAFLKALKQKGFDAVGFDKFKPEYQNTALDLLDTDIIFLCLPTPTVYGEQDLSALYDVCATLESECFLKPIVIRSTILPGTTNRLSAIHKGLRLVHCPEFLTEKNAFHDLMNQSAVLIGGQEGAVVDQVSAFWRMFDENIPILTALPIETELAKYFHNCFLAIKVTFANEMYDMAEKIGASYDKVKLLTQAQGKIGLSHLRVPNDDGLRGPQRGWGGLCFPKDTTALSRWARLHGIDARVLDAAIEANQMHRKGQP